MSKYGNTKEGQMSKYGKIIIQQSKKAENIIIEKPMEVANMMGLKMTGFEVLTDPDKSDGAYCADEEIYIEFQGKEIENY